MILNHLQNNLTKRIDYYIFDSNDNTKYYLDL